MATKEQVQEIANRGIQDQLPPDKRAKFDEMVRRGIITLPEGGGQAAVADFSGADELGRPPEATPRGPAEEAGFLEEQAAIGQNVLSSVTSLAARPVAGIGGLAKTITSGSEAGQETQEQIQEALTFQPRGEEAQAIQESAAEIAKPLGEGLKFASEGIGEFVLEKTGSPALAAFGASFPEAALELSVFKGTRVGQGFKQRRAAKKEAEKVDQAIAEAAPTVEQLKTASRSVFKEIDDLGVTVKPEAFKEVVNKMSAEAKKFGIDSAVTPKAAAALKRFQEAAESGKALTTSELDTLRKIAQNAAKSIDPADAALGVKMIDTIDDFLDVAGPKALNFPKESAANLAGRYRNARQLWGRARKSEMLQEGFEKARLQASGFENGIRTQFRSILNNKKKRRFLNKQEIEIMERVVKGGKAENLFKLIGKLGFSEGQSTQLIGTTIGIGAGATVGGPIGGVLVPLVGQVSKGLAKKLTEKGANFADAVIRAGRSGRDITRAYFRNVPKAERSAAELSELLLRSDVELVGIRETGIVGEAVKLANQRRNAGIAAATAGSGVGELRELADTEDQ